MGIPVLHAGSLLPAMPAEAAACYQDVIDEAVLGTHDGRLLHSFAFFWWLPPF